VARVLTAQLIQADREKAMLDASLMQSGKMAALGKLAAGIAHEVNNPLAVIKEKVGWLKDLLEEGRFPPARISRSSTMQCENRLPRGSGQKGDPSPPWFRPAHGTHSGEGGLNRLLDTTIDFLRNEAHYRNIEIRTEYTEPLPPITSDSAQLQQVFLNILNNAIDAVHKNGTIVVRSQLIAKGKEIAVAVADDGPGIPNEVIGKIFDPFFTTKEVGSGTGLGLSISYSIIEKLGGRILVSSQEGKGTTFTICLPLNQSG